jgi:hypothetical protein
MSPSSWVSQLSIILIKCLRQLANKEKRFVLAHSLGSFSSWLLGPVGSGPVVRQHIMMGSHSGQKERKEGPETHNPI